MEFSELVRDLGQRLGLPELEAGDDHSCTVWFDRRIEVVVSSNEASRRVSLLSVIGDMTDVPEEALSRALQGNMQGAGTGGAALSIDDLNQLWLSQTMPLTSLSFETFWTVLERFANHADFWLEHHRGETPPESELPRFAVRA